MTVPADAHPKNRYCELTTNDSWNRGSELIAGGTARPLQKKEVAFGACKKINAKEIKKMLDLSKTNVVRYTRPNRQLHFLLLVEVSDF